MLVTCIYIFAWVTFIIFFYSHPLISNNLAHGSSIKLAINRISKINVHQMLHSCVWRFGQKLPVESANVAGQDFRSANLAACRTPVLQSSNRLSNDCTRESTVCGIWIPLRLLSPVNFRPLNSSPASRTVFKDLS